VTFIQPPAFIKTNDIYRHTLGLATSWFADFFPTTLKSFQAEVIHNSSQQNAAKPQLDRKKPRQAAALLGIGRNNPRNVPASPRNDATNPWNFPTNPRNGAANSWNFPTNPWNDATNPWIFPASPRIIPTNPRNIPTKPGFYRPKPRLILAKPAENEDFSQKTPISPYSGRSPLLAQPLAVIAHVGVISGRAQILHHGEKCGFCRFHIRAEFLAK
jgi:hypothetical protein